MAEQWYVPVMAEFVPEVGSHVFRAGIPDDVYDLPNAFDQEELGSFLWRLTFRDHISLTAAQRRKMRAMGCRPVEEARPEPAVVDDRVARATAAEEEERTR